MSERDELDGLIDTGSQNVHGYRPQPPENLYQVNRNKELEADVAQFISEMFDRGLRLDPRQMASARTHFEYAFYHLNRAVFQPADPIGDAIKEGPR